MIRKCNDAICCPTKQLPENQLRYEGRHNKKYEDLSVLDKSDEKDHPSKLTTYMPSKQPV